MSTVNTPPLLSKLIRGDCIDVMKAAPAESVGFVLTDPPYVVRFRDRSGRTIKGDDRASWILPAFREAYRLLKPDSFCVSFYGWNNAEKFVWAFKKAGFTPVGHIAFVKRYPSKTGFLGAYHEQAFLLAKGHPQKPEKPLSDVLPWEYSGNRWHPTEKPLSVLRPLIESFSAPGALVLDPFAGSAGVLIAAAQLGRAAIGIEKDRGYYAAALQRLHQYRGRRLNPSAWHAFRGGGGSASLPFFLFPPFHAIRSRSYPGLLLVPGCREEAWRWFHFESQPKETFYLCDEHREILSPEDDVVRLLTPDGVPAERELAVYTCRDDCEDCWL